MQLHVPECVFSMCWYERTRACYNTLLVFCGQEEPGSAPVTQLLMALVLTFGLTSSTCLLILFTIAYLLCGMSSLKLFQPKKTVQIFLLSKTQLVILFKYIFKSIYINFIKLHIYFLHND